MHVRSLFSWIFSHRDRAWEWEDDSSKSRLLRTERDYHDVGRISLYARRYRPSTPLALTVVMETPLWEIRPRRRSVGSFPDATGCNVSFEDNDTDDRDIAESTDKFERLIVYVRLRQRARVSRRSVFALSNFLRKRFFKVSSSRASREDISRCIAFQSSINCTICPLH